MRQRSPSKAVCQVDSVPDGPRLPTDSTGPEKPVTGPSGTAQPVPAPATGTATVESEVEELDLRTLLANIFDAADEENELELRWGPNSEKR